MRIQTGEKKGHKLIYKPDPAIRPTTGKVREAVIDILRSRKLILNSRVLDLYAGTGAIGFELLSNGARHVTFVEKSTQSVRFIKQNCQKLGFDSCVRIIKEDALRACEQLISEGERFDLIYADPPYSVSDNEIEQLLHLARQLLTPDGVLIVEHSSRRTFLPRAFKPVFRKKYGDTALSFYQKEADSD